MANYAFFIGGSGARTYRALLHAAAMGILRSDQISVMRIDADSGNQAHSDCNILYEQYQNMNRLTEGKKIFQCDINPVCKEVVSPVHSNALNLRQLIGEGNNDRRRMLNAFYTEEEQKQNLTGGFYSHPNIGCIFFSNLKSEEFNACITQIDKQLKSGEMINIALVGSIFGGTGASGIPALYKQICSKLNNNPHFDKLNIGGIFLTPYFKVQGQRQKNQYDQENIPIHMDEFYFNTYQALSYYSTVIDYNQNTKFTGIYLVGQQDLDIVSDTYADFGEMQNNKAHIVEFYAALAIDSYFSAPQKKGVFGYIRNSKVSWNDFPDMEFDNGESKRIRKFVDFAGLQAFLMCEIYPNIYISDNDVLRKHGMMLAPWYHRYALKDYNIQLKQMEQYSKTFIHWLYEINSRYQEGGKWVLDKNIELFGSVLEQVYEASKGISISAHTQKPIKSQIRTIQNEFNTLINTMSNTGYVIRSVKDIAHLISSGVSGIGAIGLIMKILSCITQTS